MIALVRYAMEKRLEIILSSLVGKQVGKSCPDCGATMIVRRNRENGSYFLGCHRYPDCKVTMEIDEPLKMKLLGYKDFWEH
jgi:ssDNA-binding Zn-finger/Zn-ribbon topoisomerase 1